LLAALLYAPGTVLFVISRREQKHAAVFSRREAVVLALIVLAGVIALLGLGTGRMRI
jgi:arginine:ornithine antiporter/lysine permease